MSLLFLQLCLTYLWPAKLSDLMRRDLSGTLRFSVRFKLLLGHPKALEIDPEATPEITAVCVKVTLISLFELLLLSMISRFPLF